MKMFRVVVNDNEYRVGIEEIADDNSPSPAPATKPAAAPKPAPQPQVKEVAKPTVSEAVATDGSISAPMPGTILSVAVKVGDNVTKGQALLVLEAMKMENEIMAPSDGTVQVLNVSQGVSVNAGETLIVLS